MKLFKKTKQLFAALLCLCMIVTVLPAGIPEAQAAAGDVYTYDFTKAGLDDGNWSTDYVKSAGMDCGGNTDDAIFIQTNKDYIASAIGQYLAIKLTVPTAGMYKVNMKSLKASSGGIGDIYFMPANVTDIAAEISDDDYYIGQIDYKTCVADTPVKRVNVSSAGEYYLVFKVAAGSAAYSNIHYLYAAGAVFTWLADPVPADTLRYDFTAHPIIGQKVIEEKYGAVFSSSALACGAARYDYIYFTSSNANEDWVSLNLPGEIEAGVYSANFVTYQYSSGTAAEMYLMPKNAEVKESLTAEYYIGDMNSYASSEVLSADCPSSIDAIVKDSGEYKLVIKTKKGVSTNHLWLLDLELTRKGDIIPVGTEGISYNFSSNSNTNNWAVSDQSQNISIEPSANYLQYTASTSNLGEWLAISLNGAYLKAGTTYKPEITGYAYKSGSISDFYLIPAGADVASSMTDKYHIAEANYFATGDNFNYKPETKTITPEKDGMYILVAKVSKAGQQTASYDNICYNWLIDFSISEYVAPPEPVVTNFGSSYAYIRENYEAGKTSYDLVLIAAIDGLDYTAVGFDYTIGSSAAVKTPSITNVYETVTLGASSAEGAKLSVSAVDLGVESNGYVFYYVIEDIGNVDAATQIVFNAYAENSEGTVTGNAVTATVAK